MRSHTLACFVLLCSLAAGPAVSLSRVEATQTGGNVRGSLPQRGSRAADAQDQIDDAVQIVTQMKLDPELTHLLERAPGVFIVPHYAKGADVVGGRGDEGVLLLNREGRWSDPAFYRIGGMGVGAKAGVADGAMALVLMNAKAAQAFSEHVGRWSLNAGGQLAVVNYSGEARSSASRGDVVVWSNTKELFAGTSPGVNDITADTLENQAYYGRSVTVQQILSGSVNNRGSDSLRDELPAHLASR